MQAKPQIACYDCDKLMNVPEMKVNQSLICPGCHSKQFTKYKNPLDYSISFALSAMFMLFLANSFPFLSFESQGQLRTITLIQASQEMLEQGFVLLAVLVYAFVILLPTMYLFSLLVLIIPVKLERKLIMPISIGRILGHFLPWIMVEVFIVGVLVALIKVIELADIIIGVSFWAYVGFVVFFTLTANIASRHQIWAWIDDGKH